MTDKKVLTALGIVAASLVFWKLYASTTSYTATKNFIGSANIPEHLKPPSLLYDGDSIIVTERPNRYNNMLGGLKVNFL